MTKKFIKNFFAGMGSVLDIMPAPSVRSYYTLSDFSSSSSAKAIVSYWRKIMSKPQGNCTERKIIIEYLKAQKQSLALLIEQMDKIEVPESFKKNQKIKLSAYRIVLADITNAEGFEI